jgi:hypothetical protein
MNTLEPVAAQRLLAVVGLAPARMAAYTASGVQAAILASRDQVEAVAVIARSDAIFDFFVFAEDVRSVREGKISPLLLWARYPIALSLFAFTALILLLVLWRLIFGRRTRIVIAQNSKH